MGGQLFRLLEYYLLYFELDLLVVIILTTVAKGLVVYRGKPFCESIGEVYFLECQLLYYEMGLLLVILLIADAGFARTSGEDGGKAFASLP